MADDDETAEMFAKRMTNTILEGHVAVGVALGLDLGLFRALARAAEPITAAALSDASGCKERYIKEWLNFMTLSDVVIVDKSGTLFTLPEHRKAGLLNDDIVTPFGRAFPYLCGSHQQIKEIFRRDGPQGLAYSSVDAYTEAENHFAKQKGVCVDKKVFQRFPDIVKKLDSGCRVADLGCGSGQRVLSMAKSYPSSSFVGCDIHEPYVKAAAEEAQKENSHNTTFILQDASHLPRDWQNGYDVITMKNALHDIPWASSCLAECFRCVKPGGWISVIEYNMCSNPFIARQDDRQTFVGRLLYAVSIYMCLPVSMAHEGSEGLGTIPGTDPLEEMLQVAGFVDIQCHLLDDLQVHIIGRKPEF